MPYSLRSRICSVCGAELYGRYPARAFVRCAECGIKVLEASIRQMAEKRGIAYDRWHVSNGPRGRPRKRRR